MADVDWAAILGGGLTGGAEAYDGIQARRLREEQTEQQRLEREAALALRREELARQMTRDQAATATAATARDTDVVDRGRAVYGTTQDVPTAIADAARRIGRGNEVAPQITIDPTQAATSALAMSPMGPMAMPSVAPRFVPTAAERQQRDAVAAITAAAERLRPSNPATAAALDTGVITGKQPTLQPNDFAPPVDPVAADAAKREAAFGDFTRREDYRRAHRPAPAGPGVRKDDPKLPNGVRAYMGQLLSTYGEDRAGAEDELRRAMPSLQQDHPGLDLTAVRRQFDAAFPKPPAGGGGAAALLGLGGAKPAPAAGAPPAVQAKPPASTADVSPGQVTGLRTALQAAMQANDVAKVQQLRAQIAALKR